MPQLLFAIFASDFVFAPVEQVQQVLSGRVLARQAAGNA
jgi:hypothetical protein